MTYKDVLKLTYKDVSKMTRIQLSERVRVLSDVANKRIKRLKKSGLEYRSGAAAKLKEWGVDKFGVKGKNYGELQREFKQLKQFLDYKTSSVKELKKISLEVNRRIGQFSSIKDEKKFWDIYSKLDEMKNFNKGFESKAVQKIIYNQLNKNSRTQFRTYAKLVEDVYRSQKELEEVEENSNFITLEDSKNE